MTTTTIEKPASKVHPLKKLLVLILVFAVIIVSIVVIRSFPDKESEFVDTVAGEIQQEMAEKDVEASAGGGMVKVVMNGRQEMKSIVIDKAVMESGDNEMLQDLVMTAVNEAVRIGRANLEREMANISGGIRLPGMF